MKYRVLDTYYTSGDTIVVLQGKSKDDFKEGMEIEDENRICHRVLSTEVKPEAHIILPDGEKTVILVNGFFQGRKVVIPGNKKFRFPSFPTLE